MTPANSKESIVNIPHTILQHFGFTPSKPALPFLLKELKGSKKVITFVVDGLGYNFLINNTEKDPRFTRLKEQKQIKKITTTFPSSTAPALAAINTGEYPVEHGLLEWNLYVRELEDVIKPLPYVSATSKDALSEEPEMVINSTTIYQKLRESGIPSYFFAPAEYIDSIFSATISKGAKPIGYADSEDLSAKLRDTLEKDDNVAYIYVYWPSVDTAEHIYGPSSNEAKKALNDFLDLLFNKIVKRVSSSVQDNCFLILTADHGQVYIKEKTIYLNDYPNITNSFQKSDTGKTILPSGNGRDVFLHIREDLIDQVIDQLKLEFNNVAEIKKITNQTVKELFGDAKPHKEFHSRLGNVIILPKKGYKIWYQYKQDERKVLYGDHGGLSDDEVYIPLICAKLRDLAN